MSSMLSLNTVDLRCGICSPAEKTPEETLSYSCNTVKETEMLGAVKVQLPSFAGTTVYKEIWKKAVVSMKQLNKAK